MSILHDVRADWGFENGWQGVGVLAGLAIATVDGDGRSARHFGGCRVVLSDCCSASRVAEVKLEIWRMEFRLCAPRLQIDSG
jgi:hypothetical protein